MGTNALTIVRAAYIELGVLPPDQVLNADTAQWGLEKLNRIVDEWKTRKILAWGYEKVELTINVTKSYYTIGDQSGLADFLYERPLSLDGMGDLILTSATPNPVYPLKLVTVKGYSQIPTPTLQSSYPTTLYYVPSVPDGQLWPWPVILSAGNKIRLFLRTTLNGWFDSDGIANLYEERDLPPGYQTALIWNLAEQLLPSYSAAGDPQRIEKNARRTLYAIQSNNTKGIQQATIDSGMPNASRQGGGKFNYLTGMMNNPTDA